MAVKGNVLVCVRGFAIDIKVEGSVCIAYDGDIKHGNASVLLDLFCPFDVGVE